MAEALPDKPAGSVIEESTDPEGVTLSWPTPSPGRARYAVAAFILFWLCAWAFGWVAAAGQIVRGGNGGGPQLFLVGWLGAWTVGGGFAIWLLWAMLRPARPESVRLEAEVLRYDPGRSPYNPWQQRRWWGWGHPAVPKPTLPAEVAKSDIRGFVLERVGERQRLCFDRGADRLEIGAGLREPEREWLFAVLQRWRTPNRSLHLTAGSSALSGSPV
jgi:hypothetical protein